MEAAIGLRPSHRAVQLAAFRIQQVQCQEMQFAVFHDLRQRADGRGGVGRDRDDPLLRLLDMAGHVRQRVRTLRFARGSASVLTTWTVQSSTACWTCSGRQAERMA